MRVDDIDRRNEAGALFMGRNDVIVDDEVGLGRHPSMWWTMNCKYNAAYDVQRMNTKSRLGDASVCAGIAGDRQECFEFARDNPDLVAFMLTLRTELLMRFVMPAVVGHSEGEPYLDMARFETGPGGNPHWHGVSVGRRCPQFRHVKDDIGFEGDMPPETVKADVRLCQQHWETKDPDVWPHGVEKSGTELEELLRSALSGRRRRGGEAGSQDVEQGPDTDEEGEQAVPVLCESSSDSEGGHDSAPIDLLAGRVKAAVEGLVDNGLIEVVGDGPTPAGAGPVGNRYRRVAPVPERSGGISGGCEECGEGRSMPRGAKVGGLLDSGILKRKETLVDDKSELQEKFDEFFGGMVSDWNPC